MSDFETKDSQGNTVKTSGSANDNQWKVPAIVIACFIALIIYVVTK